MLLSISIIENLLVPSDTSQFLNVYVFMFCLDGIPCANLDDILASLTSLKICQGDIGFSEGKNHLALNQI